MYDPGQRNLSLDIDPLYLLTFAIFLDERTARSLHSNRRLYSSIIVYTLIFWTHIHV